MANADTRIKQTFKRELLLGLFSVTALAALAGAVMTSFWALGLVLKVRQYR